MQIVLIGPPGAGKGTQSVQLAEYLHVPHLSTGEMLRDVCRRKTGVGTRACVAMQRGQLVPDALVKEILFERLKEDDCRAGCILDGFPRTVPQAASFDEWLEERKRPLSMVIELRVSREELLDRLSSRGREDDDREVVLARLDQFDELTHPLLDYYNSRGVLQVVDGLGTAEEVFARICSLVDEKK